MRKSPFVVLSDVDGDSCRRHHWEGHDGDFPEVDGGEDCSSPLGSNSGGTESDGQSVERSESDELSDVSGFRDGAW